VVTVMILAGYVLPQFKPLFEELDAELPLPTRMMLFVARFFGDLWYITLIGFLVFIATIMFLTMHPTGKEIWQRVSLKIPIIGGIIEYAILERFCSVLHTMLQAGVAVPSAMETTTEAVANIVYREQLDIARQQMLEGSGFTQPLIETELFPGAARQMFKVGEETGTLDDQISQVDVGIQADEVGGIGEEVRQGIDIVIVGLAVAGIDQVLDATDVHPGGRNQPPCVKRKLPWQGKIKVVRNGVIQKAVIK
jgi:type IV pilus assembly protein PilC